ncbi:MAG: hypothetical protein QXE81_02555 [Desulfurococcaceae archaeon]
MEQPYKSLETSIKIIKSIITALEKNVIKAGEGVDKKTISLTSRIIQLLEKISIIYDNLLKRVEEVSDNVIELTQNIYLFRTPREIVLLNTKPEHVALVYNHEENSISLRSRVGRLEFTSNSMIVESRGISLKISPLVATTLSKHKDEMRIVLKYFEKIVYNKLLPSVEKRIVKKL